MAFYWRVKGWNVLKTILAVVCFVVSTCHSLNSCNIKWSKILETSGSGVELYGTKSALADAVEHGADVRFSLSDGKYISSTSNVQVLNGEVCAQALMHVSKAGWDSFQSKVYWWFLNVCTTGHTHMSRWYVGVHTKVSETRTKYTITWFVRSLKSCNTSKPEPLYCNKADGTVTCGSTSTLKEAVINGADVRLISGAGQKSYSTPLSNIDSNGGLVSGQYLWHVSVMISGNHIEFQSDAYWWFTILSSDGTRDMSRWSVGSHTDRSHTNDKTEMKWYADTCWMLAYEHDQDGNSIQGSLDYLKSAALNGHRVKMIIGSYSIESDNLLIKNGHVSAQVLGHVSKNTIKFHQNNAYWYWQHISTSGAFDTVRYNVGDTTNRGNSAGKMAVSWYVDTSTWTHVLSTSNTGTVTFGTKSNLVNAVKAGSMLRYVVKLPAGTLILQADNIAINGADVAGQTIRTVSYTDDNVRKFQSNPYWWFSIVSTQGNIRISRWTVGAHVSRGAETIKAAIDWYIN